MRATERQQTRRRVSASFISSVFISGSWSRALFVAALAISVYVLFRYWQSLKGVAGTTRWAVIALRGVALLLTACALAGVSVEDASVVGGRVWVRRTGGAVRRAGESDAAAGHEEERARLIVRALKRRLPGVVEETEEGVAVAENGADEGAFVAGILLTDGALGSDEAASEVSRLSAATGGAPVFVAGGALQPASPMVALESVVIMGRPVRGVPLLARCFVHGRGMSGRESLVTIADESQARASARVAWTADDEWQAVELEIVPKTSGRVDYTARIEAAGGEDERALLLLSRPLSLYVEERRWRVLFFEGEPTWEAKFIRRALEHSGLFEVDYFAQVSRAAAIGASEKAVEEKDDAETPASGDGANKNAAAEAEKSRAANSPEAKLRVALSSAERLNSYDCVIIGATPDEMLSAAEAARLSAWAERRGGGLVILGGNSFAGSIVGPNGKFHNLMPAAIDPRGFQSEAQGVARGAPLEAEKKREGLTLVPTAAGAGGALGGYLSAAQGSADKGDMLTGQGLRLGALRPGARALAVAGRGSLKGTSEAGSPLIVAARYGAGRTLLFAPADSWRLRTTTSAGGEQDERDAPYNALWQGLMLWATAGAEPPLEIGLSDESPPAGRLLTAELRARDAAFAPLKIERLNARLQPLTEDATDASRENATPVEVAFAPDENDQSVWRASFMINAPGQYALEVDYDAGGRSGSASKHFAVVAGLAYEPGAARDTLSRAARETGGALFSSDDAAALVERIAALPLDRAPTRRTWELRAWWPLAFIIPLLLCAAWLIERLKTEGHVTR